MNLATQQVEIGPYTFDLTFEVLDIVIDCLQLLAWTPMGSFGWGGAL